MKLCNHYEYDQFEKRYVSTIKQIHGHVFECKLCRVKLHDVDNQNLDNYLKILNKEGNMDLLSQKADIYEQLKPIPRGY